MGTVFIPVHGRMAVETARQQGLLDRPWQAHVRWLSDRIGKFTKSMTEANWADMYIATAIVCEAIGTYPKRMFGDKPFANTSVSYPLDGAAARRFSDQAWVYDFSAFKGRFDWWAASAAGNWLMHDDVKDFVDLLLAYVFDKVAWSAHLSRVESVVRASAGATKGSVYDYSTIYRDGVSISHFFRPMGGFAEFVTKPAPEPEPKGVYEVFAYAGFSVKKNHDTRSVEVTKGDVTWVFKDDGLQAKGPGMMEEAGVVVVRGEHGVFVFPDKEGLVLSAVPKEGVDCEPGFYIRAYPKEEIV